MDENVVRLRGLPWTATANDVVKFLEGCNIQGEQDGIHFTFEANGRASGEAFVELASAEDTKLALSKNKNHMGPRYIDVFKVKRSEMNYAIKRANPLESSLNSEAVVRLRGLPFGCSKEEIANFFTGLEIAPNGITFMTDQVGRTTGDAFVQFTTQESVERALAKHKESIGHRYIEIFQSTCDEIMDTLAKSCRQKAMIMRPRPYDYMDNFNIPMGGGGGGGGGGFRGGMMGGGNTPTGFGRGRFTRDFFDDGFENFGGGYGNDCGGFGGGFGRMGQNMNYGNMGMGGVARGGATPRGKRPFIGGYRGKPDKFESQTGHSVHMRGLPYSTTDEEIAHFFSPLSLVNIAIQYNADGRASGDADVDFATHEDAVEAMKRNKALIRSRYIELFLRSTPSSFGRNNRGFGFDNNGGFGNNYMAF